MCRIFVMSVLVLVVQNLSRVVAFEGSVYGINYNSRQGPDWDPNRCKNQSQVNADMKTLSAITSRVRIYSLHGCNQGAMVLEAARANEMQVWLGIWVAKDKKIFEQEKAVLESLIERGEIDDTVIGIHVGSETIYRKEITASEAIAYMLSIKKILTASSINIPVTIADIVDVYLANPILIDSVDIISANLFPFWEKTPIHLGASRFLERIQPLEEIANGKAIVISETGWSSGGHNAMASVTSPESQVKYFKDFVSLAKDKGWKYFYFSGIDEPWKKDQEGEEDTVEAHFGIFHSDGRIKEAFKNVDITNLNEEDLHVTDPVEGDNIVDSEKDDNIVDSEKDDNIVDPEKDDKIVDSEKDVKKTESDDDDNDDDEDEDIADPNKDIDVTDPDKDDVVVDPVENVDDSTSSSSFLKFSEILLLGPSILTTILTSYSKIKRN